MTAATDRTTAHEDVLGKALDRKLLRRLLGGVRPYKLQLAASLLLMPIMSGFELVQPYLLKRAIDDHIATGRLAGLHQLALMYIGALAGQYAATFGQVLLMQQMGQRAMNDLRERLHTHLLSMSAAFFDRTPVGRLMTRLTTDIESLADMFASGLVSATGDLLKLSFIVVLLLGIDLRLGALALLAVPVLLGIAAVFRPRVRDAFREIRTRMARMNAFLQEHISGMKVVQAFAQEERVQRRFDEINRDYRAANARAIGADAALFAVVEAVGAMAIAGLLWRGGARIAAGTLTFGTLVAFIEYVGKFFGPIRDLSTKYTVMQQAMAAAERVFGLMDTHEPDAPALPAAPPRPAADAPLLQVDSVTFGYRADRAVLQDLDLEVERGATVAIVGATGCGKSTLMKLLARLHDPQHGVIRLEGIDLRALPVSTLRHRIVEVAQDVFLFSGTLADNIGMGAPGLTRGRMLEAARRVGADRVIASRPEGLEAMVAERGANFSAGEKQLIAFARALCREPEILILDEATASVDPDSERLIERGIAELMAGRTSIVVAHRLSTIQRATRIVVLAHGRVVEQGTHSELLERGGFYARLWRLQSAHRLPSSPVHPVVER